MKGINNQSVSFKDLGNIHLTDIDVLHTNFPYCTFKLNIIAKIRMITGIIRGLRSRDVSFADISKWMHIQIRDVKTLYKTKSLINTPLPSYKEDIEKNVRWFLSHRCPVTYDIETYYYIKELLNTKLSSLEIARRTSVKRPIISYLRSGKRNINHMNFDTVLRLATYYKLNKSWQTLIGVEELGAKFSKVTLFAGWTNPQHYSVIGINNAGQKFKVLISKEKKNLIDNVTPKRTPNKILEACKKYASVPLKKRSFDDIQYMHKDLRSRKLI